MSSFKNYMKEFYKKHPELKTEMDEFQRKVMEKIQKGYRDTGRFFMLNSEDLDKEISHLPLDELLKYSSFAMKMSNKFSYEYNRRMYENIFKKSKRTLKDLIIHNTWESVKEILVKKDLADDEALLEYEKVYSQLVTMEPVKNKSNIVITIEKREDHGDVTGIKPWDTNSYAIEFNRWEEWLGYFISCEVLNKMTEPEIIADCLWEMTFVGFTQEEIEQEANDIDETIEDLNNMIKKLEDE